MGNRRGIYMFSGGGVGTPPGGREEGGLHPSDKEQRTKGRESLFRAALPGVAAIVAQAANCHCSTRRPCAWKKAQDVSE